nr:pantothenate kinase [uncultured Pseudomonas sp.]
MILELDCGNSFIKWRVIQRADAQLCCGGVVGSTEELLEALKSRALALSFCRLVSVRSDEETLALMTMLQRVLAIECARAQPCPELGGVHNGYEHFELLGLDRWLALVGAFRLASGACLVLDLGTAVTADFVDRQGMHLGGYICPGMPLMRTQLCTHTRRIRYDHLMAEQAQHDMSPGHSTAEAVERGCALMLQGFVRTQLDVAHRYLGDSFTVFLTGGDAALVANLLPDARVVPDLVFVGLAVACPLS